MRACKDAGIVQKSLVFIVVDQLQCVYRRIVYYNILFYQSLTLFVGF